MVESEEAKSKRKAYLKKYYQRPEVKAKMKKYRELMKKKA